MYLVHTNFCLGRSHHVRGRRPGRGGAETSTFSPEVTELRKGVIVIIIITG